MINNDYPANFSIGLNDEKKLPSCRKPDKNEKKSKL